jgi:hypothetical protein
MIETADEFKGSKVNEGTVDSEEIGKKKTNQLRIMRWTIFTRYLFGLRI